MFGTITTNGSRQSVTINFDGENFVADDSHPYFDEIVEALIAGDETLVDYFNVAQNVALTLSAVTERISIADDTLYFDSEPVHNTLADAILRGLDNGEDITPLALFMERLADNPVRHSRIMAYDWLEAQGSFSIDRDGMLVGYKGVRQNGEGFESIYSGTAFVNGVQHNGHIPNNVGNVVSMARNKVTHDPHLGCSVGLHVGTWDYANNWGNGVVLKVRVNPRDIVSVPTDCAFAKMRVARYQVLESISAPLDTLVDDEVYDEPEYIHEDELSIW